MTTNSSKRSTCPLANTLDLIGDKWTLIVIRDLFSGKTHFKEFSESPEHIATNILSNRLRRLRKLNFIATFPSPIYQGRKAYQLTQKGKSLRPLLKSISNWGLEHISGTRASI